VAIGAVVASRSSKAEETRDVLQIRKMELELARMGGDPKASSGDKTA
jgi:hypothetical protein